MIDKELWLPLQSTLRIAVASSSSDKLLGVRDGFLRFLRSGMQSDALVAVSSGLEDTRSEVVPASDEEAMRMAKKKLERLEAASDSHFHCRVASEGGLCVVNIDDELRYFVRTWTVISGFGGEAWGASGSIQIPASVFDTAGGREPRSVPGTRRGGGMMGSITRGLENRRQAVALSTANAFATLVFDGLGAELV